MRKITDVIPQILALIPTPSPIEVADNMTVLAAELNVLNRAAHYTPPESNLGGGQWARLESTLYRYMPPPTAFPWAQQISDLVRG